MTRKLPVQAKYLIEKSLEEADLDAEPMLLSWPADALLAIGATYLDPSRKMSGLQRLVAHLSDEEKKPAWPIHGLALGRYLSTARKNPAMKTLLREGFKKAYARQLFCYQYKDPEETGLIASGIEVGGDPFTRLWERFSAVDTYWSPSFNAALIWTNEALISLGYALGEDTAALIEWNEWAVYAMNDLLWHETKGYYGVVRQDNLQWKGGLHVGALAPMAAGIPTQEQAERLLMHVVRQNWGGEGPWLVQAPSSDHTIDLLSSWILFKGFLHYDMHESAARIQRDALKLAGGAGIYAGYNAKTGEGLYGCNNPCAAVLLLELLHG